MLSEQRKEATKLAASLINTIAAAYLLSGLVAPFLPGAGTASLFDVMLRIGAGFMVHMLAQTVLFFGLRDTVQLESEQDEPDSSNVDNRLSVSNRDRDDIDRISSNGEARKPESTKPEKLS